MQINILLSVYLIIFSSIIVNAQSYMLKPIQTINSQGVEQIFVDSTELYWLSRLSSSIQLWKENELQKQFQIPNFIDLQLKLLDDNTKISGGYFEYDIKSKEYIGSRALANILNSISPQLILNEFIYEVENSLFDIKSNRLVMALHHRPSRRGDPKLDIEIPFNILGLVKLDTKELVSILDRQLIVSYGKLIITSQYVVGPSMDYVLSIWRLENGEKVETLPFVGHYISRIPNKESFIITLVNGDVIEYDILESKQILLKKGGALTQRAFALGVDSLYMFFEDNAKGILYKKHHEKLEKIDEIVIDGSLVDFYFNEKKRHLWIATDSDNYSIKVYKLTQ